MDPGCIKYETFWITHSKDSGMGLQPWLIFVAA